jgi:dTDP-4-dehydrorhamnose 3,5-epimerase-like enzyme
LRSADSPVVTTTVRGVTLHRLARASEPRGLLVAGEFDRQIPFVPKRYFIVSGVPATAVRGNHAHRTCHQFLVCIRGSVTVVADDGAMVEEITLDNPAEGLYLPPLIWADQRRYSSDAILLVFASDYYEEAEYIRDRDESRRLIER